MKKLLFGIIFVNTVIILSFLSSIHEILLPKRTGHPTIFCMILTHPGHLKSRANAVHEAWATKCDTYKFISVIPDEWLNNSKKIITSSDKLNGFEMTFENKSFLQPYNLTNDVYGKLSTKVFHTFRYLYEHYSHYDFYLKADDDAFIFVDNLRKFLSDQNRTSPETYGFDFHCYGGYHSGGGGYVLTNEALTRIGSNLSKNISHCRISGIEDTDVAECLEKNKVFGKKSLDEQERERFHAIDIRRAYYGEYTDWWHNCAANKLKNGTECCSETQTISFHNTYAKDQLKLAKIAHLKFSELIHRFFNDKD
jgi:glycoprotein-N-acetylgalactosamine 3-beta-galactosyltransferase